MALSANDQARLEQLRRKLSARTSAGVALPGFKANVVALQAAIAEFEGRAGDVEKLPEEPVP